MDWFSSFLEFMCEHPDRIRDLAQSHLKLSITALGVACLIFLPLGIYLARPGRLNAAIVGVIASFRVIPSIALIFLFYTWLGFGYRPAVFALTIL
ncbi:MAG: ABC transporter permease, partial [Thermomicrobiales bacterium]